MKKTINKNVIKGYLYSHKLTAGQSKKNGANYVRGSIQVAVNPEATNIIDINVLAMEKNAKTGAANATYAVLMNILNGNVPSVMADGVESAQMISVNTQTDINEYFTPDRNTGELTLVSFHRNNGGFINVGTFDKSQMCATFELDMLITKVTRKEPTDRYPESETVSGWIFDYKGAMFPISLKVENPKAMDYFEGLDASSSNPIFTKVKGNQKNIAITREVRSEGLFGDDISYQETNDKAWVITNTWEPYAFGDEEVLSMRDIKNKLSERQLYLAELEQSYKQRQAEKQSGANAATKAIGQFDF